MDNRTKIVIVLSREKEAKEETYLGQHPRMLKQRHQKNFVFFEISEMIVVFVFARARTEGEKGDAFKRRADILA